MIAEVRQHWDGRTTTSEYINTDLSLPARKSVSTSKLEVLGNSIKYTTSDENNYGNDYFSSTESDFTILIQDIEKVEISDIWYNTYPEIAMTCKNENPCMTWTTESSVDTQERGSWYYIKFPGSSAHLGLFDANLQAAEKAINALNNLIAHYNGGGDTETGQPAMCYKWASLGYFHLGTWVNGNGRETSALNAGSDTRLWDDEELAEEYQASREQCVSSANGALDNAISAMFIIGRQAVDVDNEKRRIRDFYQANLNKCQAEFKRRFKKYENKFCE